MGNNMVYIYEDSVQKLIDELEKMIDRNCLELYNRYKPQLEEAYMEGVIEYETLLTEYHITERDLNAPLYLELERIYTVNDPVKVMDINEIYFHSVVQ